MVGEDGAMVGMKEWVVVAEAKMVVMMDKVLLMVLSDDGVPGCKVSRGWVGGVSPSLFMLRSWRVPVGSSK